MTDNYCRCWIEKPWRAERSPKTCAEETAREIGLGVWEGCDSLRGKLEEEKVHENRTWVGIFRESYQGSFGEVLHRRKDAEKIVQC